MKAAVYRGKGGTEIIGIEDRPLPEYGPEQALVRVQASGLNRADVMQRMGNYPSPPGSPADIPGLEFAGVVEAVGSGVFSVKPGQRVFGITAGGGQAEYVVSHQRLLVPIPDNLSIVEAAAVPGAFITASDALFALGGLASGETVLVHAVGSSVGLAAFQLARAAGCTVIGTSRSASKLSRAAELGLDHGIDTSQQDFGVAVAELTRKRGVQVVIDFVGAPYLAGNLAALAIKGRLIEVASMGGTRGELNIGLLMRKRAQIIGTGLRSRPLEEKGIATQLFADRVVPQLANGLIKVVVNRIYPLEELAAAHDYMEADLNFGKIVLSLDPATAPVS